jgi:hypothetical protein
MGLLDDAIREHLDLKRRRGADPSEIAREESEALGPVRRDAAAEEDAGVASRGHEGGSYADHEPAALDEPAAVYDDEPAYDEPAYEREAPPARYDEDRLRPADPPITHDAPYPEAEEESATPPHGDPLAHQPTREFSATEVGDALGHEEPARAQPAATPPHGDVVPADDDGEEEAEDELEDTPDFLQETPEHDRLWFEQKPPKDFDF